METDLMRARRRRAHSLDIDAAEVVLAVELLDLLDDHPDLVHSASPDGRLLFANRAWLRDLGYARADLPRLTILDVIAPEDHPLVVRRLADVLEGETLPAAQLTLVAADGRRVVVEGGEVMHRMDGAPIGTICIMRHAAPVAATKHGAHEA